MGAALAANIENAKKILTTLINELSIPVTCKIRIKESDEETIAHVKELVTTGIKAIAIHARTRDERPQHKPHPEVVKAVAEAIDIPVICNGGSREIDRYSDIFKFKEACGASSVMLARAAEWNVTIFRPEGQLPLMDVIRHYLKVAVDYDAYPANAKYWSRTCCESFKSRKWGKDSSNRKLSSKSAKFSTLKTIAKQNKTNTRKKKLCCDEKNSKVNRTPNG